MPQAPADRHDINAGIDQLTGVGIGHRAPKIIVQVNAVGDEATEFSEETEWGRRPADDSEQPGI